MIKFFRKIRQQFIYKNQIKKYSLYAIGEILLVVIGILIALQINNWNENRKVQTKEKIILQSLLDEFKTNKSSLEGAMGRVDQRQQRCISLLQMVSNPEVNFPKHVTDSLMFGLRSFVSFDVSDGYIEGLLSTGDIRILQNDSLRHLVTNWDKEVLDNALEIELLMKQELNNIITPYLMVHYSSATEGVKRYFPYQTPFAFDHKSIFKNPQFENILIEKITRFYECKSGYEHLNHFIEHVISITERELQK